MHTMFCSEDMSSAQQWPTTQHLCMLPAMPQLVNGQSASALPCFTGTLSCAALVFHFFMKIVFPPRMQAKQSMHDYIEWCLPLPAFSLSLKEMLSAHGYICMHATYITAMLYAASSAAAVSLVAMHMQLAHPAAI